MSRRNLATMDTDMFTPIGRLLQQAMAHGIMNDMIFGGLEAGQTALQGLCVESATKNCVVGTRRVTWDGRVHRYSRAENIISVPNFGLKFYGQMGDGIAANVGQAQAVGDTTILIAGTDVAEDEFAGGYAIIHVSGNQQFRGILGNTAIVGAGNITVTLDEALAVVVPNATYTELLQNPYSNVSLCAGPSGGHAGNDFSSVAGIPNCITTVAGYYLWLQTWGPRWINPHGDAATGVAGSERKLVFDCEGSVCVADESGHGPCAGTDGDEQLAGFIIDRTAGGPPLVMLQISPQIEAIPRAFRACAYTEKTSPMFEKENKWRMTREQWA